MAKLAPALQRTLETGLAAHQAARLDEAEAAYRAVLKRLPTHPDALNLLGVIAHQRDRHTRAIQLISQALRARPDFPEALVNLARAQRAAGDAAGAAEHARQAIARAPNLAEAHIQLGRALLDLEEYQDAAEACRDAIAIAPESLDAHVNLAAALTRLKDFAGAADAYIAAHRMRPDRAETLTDLGAVLTELRRYDDALRCHERAAALTPNAARVHAEHAATLKAAQDVAGSEAACRRALALDPKNAEVWLLQGSNMAALGRFQDAIACQQRVLELNPRRTEARRRMVAAGDRMTDDGDKERLRDVAGDATSPPRERVAAGFALGAALDKDGAFDEAFHWFATANRLRRAARIAAGTGFDRADLIRRVDRLIDVFSPQAFGNAGRGVSVTEQPLFVVGMPRSGTTLTEQILASHALIEGAGELTDIGQIAATLDIENAPAGLAGWDAMPARPFGDAYIDRLRTLGGDAVRVTDKMPDNILWLGLIAVLFPNARVVVCRRDLRDVCLSCYFQSFGTGLAWSDDLEDCALRAREVERLWQHWQAVLPLRMHVMRYETLVGDLEGESRRLIDFAGLPWDPACLAFHETERQVMTASLWQVRQPLYASSVGRWRHYRQHISPLLTGLAGLVAAETAAPSTERPDGAEVGWQNNLGDGADRAGH